MSMANVYNTIGDQNITDIAVQLYGDPSFVVQILKDNPNIASFGRKFAPGTPIVYSGDLMNINTFSIRKRRIDVSTGANYFNPSLREDFSFELGEDGSILLEERQ